MFLEELAGPVGVMAGVRFFNVISYLPSSVPMLVIGAGTTLSLDVHGVVLCQQLHPALWHVWLVYHHHGLTVMASVLVFSQWVFLDAHWCFLACQYCHPTS